MRISHVVVLLVFMVAFILGCGSDSTSVPNHDAVVIVTAEYVDMQTRTSGFIASSDGHIFASLEAMAPPERIDVSLADGRSLPASLLNMDDVTGIAMLKIEALELPTLKLAAGPVLEELEIGEQFTAAGCGTDGYMEVAATILDLHDFHPQFGSVVRLDADFKPALVMGPVMDAAREVVGIIVAFTPETCEAFMVSSDHFIFANLGPIGTQDEAVEKINGYVISRVGETFFNAYISFKDVSYVTGSHMGERWRGVYPGLYHVVYYFDMPKYDFVDDEIIEVVVSPNGNILREDGIPDPDRCDFISESEAVDIAKEAGLAEGIEPPEELGSIPASPNFGWVAGKFKAYAWYIENITHVDADEVGGEYLSIDAYSGEILQRGEWMMTPGYRPRAPEGTPLEVLASAVYVDDAGRLMRRGEDIINVIGVEITITDAEGESQTKISAEYYVQFEMLADHSYIVEATFNDSTESTEAVIKGFQGLEFGGFISVRVWQSSDTIESVSYQEPLLE